MKKDAMIFLSGCCIYPTIEMLWRGRTHFSMVIAGGICMVIINKVCCEWLGNSPIIVRSVVGAGVITLIELFLGFILNYHLGLRVWDYSEYPFNLFGQVCLPYSILWMILILPAMGLCEICRRSFFSQDE